MKTFEKHKLFLSPPLHPKNFGFCKNFEMDRNCFGLILWTIKAFMWLLGLYILQILSKSKGKFQDYRSLVPFTTVSWVPSIVPGLYWVPQGYLLNECILFKDFTVWKLVPFAVLPIVLLLLQWTESQGGPVGCPYHLLQMASFPKSCRIHPLFEEDLKGSPTRPSTLSHYHLLVSCSFYSTR